MQKKARTTTGSSSQIHRRSALKKIGGALSLGALGCSGISTAGEEEPLEKIATRGRINQSLVYWCFEKYWNIETMCRITRDLGMKSIELIDKKHWPTLKTYGLACAITGSHGFEKGMNNPQYHPMCIEQIRQAVDSCAEFGFPNVITFTGFRENIPDDVGLENCVTGLKKIIGHAEKKKVNLCLEILNSRVAEEMKGHPGYQGDHTDYCMEIVRRVGSPRMKILFDIYHVQVMDGDIITRIRQYKDFIGHVHTAGNPGRMEIGDQQEINYRPIMEEIVKTGYTGYVGQEFVPTRDPLESLKEAVAICDV